MAYTTSKAPLLIATVRDGLAVTMAPNWYRVPGVRVPSELATRYPLGETVIGIKTDPGRKTAPLSALLDHLRANFVPGAALSATVG
jgi:hypothetical protein